MEHWWNYFLRDSTAPSGPGPPRFRRLTITFRHTTPDRTPLEKWSESRRYLYLKNTQNSLDREHPCPRRIRNHNPSKRAAADPHLWRRDHWDRLGGMNLMRRTLKKIPFWLLLCPQRKSHELPCEQTQALTVIQLATNSLVYGTASCRVASRLSKRWIRTADMVNLWVIWCCQSAVKD